MREIQEVYKTNRLPVRVVQFGEGRLLRALIEPIFQKAVDEGRFAGSVAIVKPTGRGNLDVFERQSCLYTVILRGKQAGKVSDEAYPVTCVDRAVNPYRDFESFLALARLPELSFVISNTTEAGIVLDREDRFDAAPPASFPGKLTRFLYERYRCTGGAKDAGLVMLPTELIERNGDRLRECVLSLASIWGLEEGFAAWVREACVFCSTLVDRIVSGCPPEELPSLWERLGYRDELLTVGEPFGMWAIEAPENVAARLPIDGPGSPAFFVRDLAPWKQRKVRILNGGHTSMVPAAFLAGKDLVRECMDDAVIHRFLTETEAEEIVPYVPLPRADALAFAGEVEQRFENPFLDHRLLDICANSFAKWKERVLPSVRDCYAAGKLPRRLVFSFAALLAFYTAAEKKDGELFGLRDGQPYRLQESAQVLALAERFSSGSPEAYVEAAMREIGLWEEREALPRFAELAAADLRAIRETGALRALAAVTEGGTRDERSVSDSPRRHRRRGAAADPGRGNGAGKRLFRARGGIDPAGPQDRTLPHGKGRRGDQIRLADRPRKGNDRAGALGARAQHGIPARRAGGLPL